MLTRRVLRPLPQMPATQEIERDHSLARIGLFLCFCVSAVAFSMAVAKLPIKNLGSVPQLQFLSSFIGGATAPAASASPLPLTAPSAIVLASPAASTPATTPALASPAPASAATTVEVVAPAPITAPSVAASPEASAAAPASASAKRAAPSAQPAASAAASSAPPSPKAASPSPSKAAASTHASYTVEPGDTLFAIARKYGVTTQALAGANGLSASGAIRAGQKLAIPG